jgi:hypothetical protein
MIENQANAEPPRPEIKASGRWPSLRRKRLLLGLLAIEGLLFLSAKLPFFSISEQANLRVPIAFGRFLVAAAIALVALVIVLPIRRRWFQIRLRTLLIVTAVCAVGCAWLARRIDHKRNDREAVEAIVALRGHAIFDHQENLGESPSGPRWLRKLLGENFFREVVEVDIYDAQMDDATTKKLQGLTQLRMLRLRGTKFTGAVLNLKPFAQLHTLELMDTNITDAGLEGVKSATQLQKLVLAGSNITDAALINIKGLSQLQTLGLIEIRVTDAGLANIRELTRLRELYLSDSNVGDAGMENLKSLTQLQVLYLRKTHVTDAGLANLAELTQLRQLCLQDANIGDAGMKNLSRLSQLRELYLGGTNISDAGLAELKGLAGLQELDLLGTKVSDAGVKDLSGFTELRILTVWKTGVSDAAVKDLQTALPNLKFGP